MLFIFFRILRYVCDTHVLNRLHRFYFNFAVPCKIINHECSATPGDFRKFIYITAYVSVFLFLHLFYVSPVCGLFQFSYDSFFYVTFHQESFFRLTPIILI